MHDAISKKDKTLLRELARKQLAYSQLPVMKKRQEEWRLHNDLEGRRPMIHFETRTFEEDLLPPPECAGGSSRRLELELRRNVLNHELVDDDRVVPDFFRVPWETKFSLFGVEIGRERARDAKGRMLGYALRHPVKDLKNDLPKLKESVYGVDRAGTMSWKELIEDLIGDILPVRMEMSSVKFTLSHNIVSLMGMEKMIYAMMDEPDLFGELLERVTGEHIEYFKWLEEENLLLPNNGNTPLAQGSFCFTGDLPAPDYSGGNLRLGDSWGYMDSQETVGISPAMYGEFFFPHYERVSSEFGLVSYGCCEPVHPVWKDYLAKLPGLRKISVSPWCDEEYIGEMLRGKRVIFHRKPSPNFVGVGKELDEDAFRKHILKTIGAARGCALEFSFRDVYTLSGNTGKLRRAVEIVRELTEKTHC